MKPSDAVSILQNSVKNVNWINFGRVLDAIAEHREYGRYDNSKWKPNFEKAALDKQWLAANMDEISEAIDVLRQESKDKRRQARLDRKHVGQ